jgi:hypothetical protein
LSNESQNFLMGASRIRFSRQLQRFKAVVCCLVRLLGRYKNPAFQ